MSRTTILALAAALLCSGCPEPDKPPPAPPPKDTPTAGRAETRNIRNLDAIGVQGSAIADKVDGALQANEGRQDQLDAAQGE